MNILALDCGEFCGFATLIDGQIESGVEHLKYRGSESLGFKYLRFTELLNRLYCIGGFDLIVYEKPHGLKGHAIESMNGYITRIHEFIAKREIESWKIEYKGYSPATIKKFTTGHGNASKEMMIEYFEKATGRKPIDSNEADAYFILLYALDDLGIKKG